MTWIVLGEDNGRIKLVSKSNTGGILPKGSYLTVENKDTGGKFILRVDDTRQSEPYSPSPLVVEMDLSPLKQDQECQNVISAYRVRDVSSRGDGLIDFIPPQSVARLANQDEIDSAVGSSERGPRIFVATVHSSRNQKLRDENGKAITVRLPEELFFHQTMISGRTGSGKTVAAKYLAQYFAEELHGAVLMVNVKDVDLLRMNRPSRTTRPDVKDEWASLSETPHGIDDYVIYYPATISFESSPGVDREVCKRITLDVQKIEPDSLTGLLHGISDTAAQNLPNVFRYWQSEQRLKKQSGFTFGEFVSYFQNARSDDRLFSTMNSRGEVSSITIHRSTYDNILRTLDYAVDFFDNKDAISIDESDVLSAGKVSVINVAGNKGIQFGSILLRDLLHRIVEAKITQRSSVPVLIVIDEVHRFYDTDSSKETLGDLDTICRTGRSQEIGVIFSSQNPSDIPRGLASVVNTKIFFKTDSSTVRGFGLKISDDELEGLKAGYAVSNVHEMSSLKVIKFPMSLSGVFEERV